MAFRFQANEPVESGVKRIVLEQLGKAIAEIDDPSLPRPEAVHQVRRRCKKIRSVLRLVRGELGRHYPVENQFYRNISRALSGLRDAAVMVNTCDAILDTLRNRTVRRQFVSLRRKLVRHCQAVERDQADYTDRLSKVRKLLGTGSDRTASWNLATRSFDAIETGLLRTYSRGRKARRRAHKRPDASRFHEWRKRVKYHLYHLLLLRSLWPPVMKPLRRETQDLSDLLGDDHDLAVLRDRLLREPKTFGDRCELQPVLTAIDRRSHELRALAAPLGKLIFAEKRGSLGRRFRKYWRQFAE